MDKREVYVEMYKMLREEIDQNSDIVFSTFEFINTIMLPLIYVYFEYASTKLKFVLVVGGFMILYIFSNFVHAKNNATKRIASYLQLIEKKVFSEDMPLPLWETYLGERRRAIKDNLILRLFFPTKSSFYNVSIMWFFLGYWIILHGLWRYWVFKDSFDWYILLVMYLPFISWLVFIGLIKQKSIFSNLHYSYFGRLIEFILLVGMDVCVMFVFYDIHCCGMDLWFFLILEILIAWYSLLFGISSLVLDALE
jgi:hypothetical protein